MRINENDSIDTIVNKMCSGEEDVRKVVQMIIKAAGNTKDIVTLDKLGIYGLDINTLWIICCNNNYLDFISTIYFFRSETYSEDEIHTNLNFASPIPFLQFPLDITDERVIYELDNTENGWHDWRKKNRSMFKQLYNQVVYYKEYIEERKQSKEYRLN